MSEDHVTSDPSTWDLHPPTGMKSSKKSRAFALLLSRDLKRNFKLLASIAVFILVMRAIDIYWQVMPDASRGALALSWLDFAAIVGLGGIWAAFFLIQLEKRPLMPLNDPELVETLDHGRE